MPDRSVDGGHGGTNRFDPRFDPAFQPGYDARNDPAAAARTASPLPFESTRPSVQAVPTPVQAPPAPSAEEDGVEDASAEVDPASEEDAPRTSVTNPYLRVLWVLSVVLVVIGFGMVRWVTVVSSDISTSGTSAYDFYFLQTLVLAAPIFVALGIATAVGILLMHAARWSTARAKARK